MSHRLKDYARIGLVHHMLYARSVDDPDYHVETLEAVACRTDIETFDCCLPYGKERRERLIPVIRGSGKEHIVFAVHLFPLRKLSFCATAYAEQAQARMIVADMIEQAAAIGATGFIFASGGPPYAEGTKAHQTAFYDFCCWLCEQLARHQIEAQLEPFDFDFDKKFHYGPLDLCLELTAKVRRDFPNFGLELDLAHLPLMREDIAPAIHRAAPYLRRIHLGNCVKADAKDPFYGDKHPPIGYPGGEIDVEQVAVALGALRDVGFLDPTNRGDVILELNPFPGRTADESVADNLARIERAWELAITANLRRIRL